MSSLIKSNIFAHDDTAATAAKIKDALAKQQDRGQAKGVESVEAAAKKIVDP